MVVDGNALSPGGGLDFDARFRGNLSLSGVASESAHDLGHDVRGDPVFFVIYLLVILCLLVWSGWAGARWVWHGRRSI
jgi:hypothetical protein